MRLAGVAVAVALLAAGCARLESSSSGERAAAAPAKLVIEVSPGAGPDRIWTLSCTPPAGTLPRRAQACARLARLSDPFAPTPTNVACSEVYGGPQVGQVRGTFRGRRVRASFNRTNGCEIERWNRVAFLFPSAP